MRYIVRYGAILGIIALAALIAVGCGGDDDKGTGPTGLTKEEQFDSLSAFLNFDPGSESDGIDVVSTMLFQLSPAFWDGIDESDLDNFFGELFAPGLSGAAKPAIAADTTLTITYDPVGGWWLIDFQVSETDEAFGIVLTATLKDSIRFEMTDGTAQMVPDEATTYRFIQKAAVTLFFGFGTSANGLEFDFQVDAYTDVTGLNTATVVINGDGEYDLGVAAAGEEGSVDMTLTMQADWDNVSFANVGEQDVCPTSGQITGGFTLDLDVQEDGNRYQETGTWNIGIGFTGNGMATVTVQSGDFSEFFSGQVCTP